MLRCVKCFKNLAAYIEAALETARFEKIEERRRFTPRFPLSAEFGQMGGLARRPRNSCAKCSRVASNFRMSDPSPFLL